MKSMLIFLLFLLNTFVSSVRANDIQDLYLDEGINKVSLSIVNFSNSDLSNIRVEVDKTKIPKWLDIHIISDRIDIPYGVKSYENILLILNVNNAPSGTVAEFPYKLSDNSGNSWNFTATIHTSSDLPISSALHENFPNPFNPITTISYKLKENKHTKLVVYNTLGQQIYTLVDALQAAGMHTVQWDGKNKNGQKVSSGMYFYRLTAGSFVQTKRMMLVE